MNNFHLAALATTLCLLLGAIGSASVAFLNLEGMKLIFASFIGLTCLPFGLFLAYMTYQEFELET